MLNGREEIFDMLENVVDNIWGVCELSLTEGYWVLPV